MEEAAQILEIETFIPLLLQVTLLWQSLKTLTYDVQALWLRINILDVNLDYWKTTAMPCLKTHL